MKSNEILDILESKGNYYRTLIKVVNESDICSVPLLQSNNIIGVVIVRAEDGLLQIPYTAIEVSKPMKNEDKYEVFDLSKATLVGESRISELKDGLFDKITQLDFLSGRI